jgi:F-type H+-transporting ATPase subunit delta
MKNMILANRDAKALFAVGKEDDCLDEFSRVLVAMADLFATMPEVRDALTNPMYPLDVRAKVMAHLITAAATTPLMGSFLNLVVQKKRAAVLPEIAEAFQILIDTDRNICQGVVVSATALSAALQAQVQATLEKITGKNVVLSTQVDSSLIGGLIAKVGDLVLDGSIKTQLSGLTEAIKGSE